MAENSSLGSADRLILGLRHTWYTCQRTLGLNKLREWLQGASLTLVAAVWLLGQCYSGHSSADSAECEEALAQLLLHFRSILWMTYREGFTPIGDAGLRTDCGWGCTLRSGQMILAQGLQRHRLGAAWRWPMEQPLEPPPPLAALLQLFWDAPSHRHPFSIHNLCSYGAACGVHPGRWLGPWVMCRTLEAAARAAAEHQDLGVHVAVLADSGGGAPLLYTGQFDEVFGLSSSSTGEGSGSGERAAAEQQAAQAEQQTEGRQEAAGGSPGAASSTRAATNSTGGSGGDAHSSQGGGSVSSSERGLILLVPLVLGLGKANPRYLPQLCAVLGLSQSIGIVGGAPSRSLYFVGCQQGSLLFLDPHEVQPAASCDGDWLSFHCGVLRTMPLASIDPSLALGFYCHGAGDFQDLCQQLAELERGSGGAPLLCVTSHRPAAQQGWGSEGEGEDEEREPRWEPSGMSASTSAASSEAAMGEGSEGLPAYTEEEAERQADAVLIAELEQRLQGAGAVADGGRDGAGAGDLAVEGRGAGEAVAALQPAAQAAEQPAGNGSSAEAAEWQECSVAGGVRQESHELWQAVGQGGEVAAVAAPTPEREQGPPPLRSPTVRQQSRGWEIV